MILLLGLNPNLLNRVHKVASYLRTALFWAITPRVVVITYRRFGTTYKSHLKGPGIPGFLTLEDGTSRLSRNVGKEFRLHAV
jgi:hypothetical protein